MKSFEDSPAAPKELQRKKRIAEAAERALREAEERRQGNLDAAMPEPREQGGQQGPDPARYGDWEKDGIISDF